MPGLDRGLDGSLRGLGFRLAPHLLQGKTAVNSHVKPLAPRRARGFTLVELMVVVAIIAILSAIAMSAYGGYITRSKIQAAKGDLSALSLNLENEFQRNLEYSVRSKTASTSDTVASVSSWTPAEAKDFNYTIESSKTDYTLTATGTTGSLVGCLLTLTSAPPLASSSSSGGSSQKSAPVSLGTVNNCGSVTTW